MISECDTEDESIIRLLPFLGMDKFNATASKDDDENFQYDITAVIKAVCTLDSKVLGEYKILLMMDDLPDEIQEMIK